LIVQDKLSSRRAERPGLAAALDYLRGGDVLMVWKLDRLGRSVKEVLTIADELYERGVGLRVLTGTLAGTYTPSGEGKFFFVMWTRRAGLAPTVGRVALWCPETSARGADVRVLRELDGGTARQLGGGDR